MNALLRGVAQRLTASAAGDTAEKWSLLFPRGEWHGANLVNIGGKIDLTDDVFAQMIASWKEQGQPLLPVYWHHVTDERDAVPVEKLGEVFRAAGHITGLRITPQGLEASVSWSAEGKRDVEGGAYAHWSAEWQKRYQDRNTGKVVDRWSITGAALTDTPFFNTMPRLAASTAAPTQEHRPMDKKLLCAALGMPEDSTEEAIVAKCKMLCSAGVTAAADAEKVKAALAVEADAKATAAVSPIKAALDLATAAATEAKAAVTAKDAEIEKLKASAKATEKETFLASLTGYGASQRVAVGKYLDAMGFEEAKAFAKTLTPVDTKTLGVTGTETPADKAALKAEFEAELDAATKDGTTTVLAASKKLNALPKFAPLFAVR